MTDIASTHEATLRSAAAGDDQALAELVRLYHDRVYRFGLCVCRDAFDADDAVQEAFVALSRRPDVQRHRGLLAWLMTTIRNACLAMMRPFLRERARLGERVGNPEDIVDAMTPDALLDRFRLVQSVHRAIANVPQDQREVLVLRDVEGLSGEEVCARLGISSAAMKSRLHRARAMVRSELESMGTKEEEDPITRGRGRRDHR
jgi:RNA polymerase sigma-70 factor, ECF subfamily